MQVIRSLLGPKKYVIVVEHDLAVLDYLSDFICCLYGKPGAYGVVTMPFSVREGINIFLAGFVPTENLRFREEALTFKARCPITPALLSSLPGFCIELPKQGSSLSKRIFMWIMDSRLLHGIACAVLGACMA